MEQLISDGRFYRDEMFDVTGASMASYSWSRTPLRLRIPVALFNDRRTLALTRSHMNANTIELSLSRRENKY